MLLAVSMGFEQSPRSVLSKRRWMRRLLLASFRRMIAFTRNPLVHSGLEKADTPVNPRKAEGFRDSHNSPPPEVGRFACLRARWPWYSSLRLNLREPTYPLGCPLANCLPCIWFRMGALVK